MNIDAFELSRRQSATFSLGKFMPPSSRLMLGLVTCTVLPLGYMIQLIIPDQTGPFLLSALWCLAGSVLAVRVLLIKTEMITVLRPFRGPHLYMSILMGAQLFLFAALQIAGRQTSSTVNSNFLTGLYILLVPCLNFLLHRKLPDTPAILSSGVALLGIFFLAGIGMSVAKAGDWLILLSAIVLASHTVLMSRLVKNTDRLGMTVFVQLMICGSISLICALIYEPIDSLAIAMSWKKIAFGVLFTVFLIMFEIYLREVSLSEANVMMSSVYMITALMTVKIFHAPITAAGVSGCALIGFALYLALFRHRRTADATS
jgi:drug/metabolite transporter (DMT)-like permease